MPMLYPNELIWRDDNGDEIRLTVEDCGDLTFSSEIGLLSRKDCAELAPVLQHFADTGRLSPGPEAKGGESDGN